MDNWQEEENLNDYVNEDANQFLAWEPEFIGFNQQFDPSDAGLQDEQAISPNISFLFQDKYIQPDMHEDIKASTMEEQLIDQDQESESEEIVGTKEVVNGVNKAIQKSRKMKTWTEEENVRLLQLYKYHLGNWQDIAKEFTNRTVSQCKQHWRRIDPSYSEKRKLWTDQEDKIILANVQQSETQNWAILASKLSNRTGKQVRDRYMNYLRPGIKNDDWTQQEDQKLLDLQSKIGSKWAQISQLLPGRSENMVKNRFNKISKPTKLSLNVDDFITKDPELDTQSKVKMQSKKFDFHESSYANSQTHSHF